MNSAPEPVLFGTAIEALANAMGPRITPDVKQELKLKGVDLEKLQTAYNVATWTDALTVLATRLLGEVPESERYVELGRLFMRGFVGSPLGIAALALSKLLGPRRALEPPITSSRSSLRSARRRCGCARSPAPPSCHG